MRSVKFDFDKFKNTKIAVFGDFMVDEYLRGTVSRISPEAPVPVVHVRTNERRLGGAGNVVFNLCSLGAKPVPICLLGDDNEGDWLIQKLFERGADTKGIMKSAETVTSIKTRVTAQNQQLLRYDRETVKQAPKEFEKFLSDNAEKFLNDASAVIVSDYGKGVVTKKTAEIIIRAAKSRNIPVIVDPKGSDYSKYKGASVCTPNMKELQEAVGRTLGTENEISEAGQELCERNGISYILATRSEKGMSLIDGRTGAKKDYPAIAKEVIDVTGAGDTVISVFTLCFALGADFDDCCRIANSAASIVVSKFGAAVASPAELKQVIDGIHNNGALSESKILSIEQAAKKADELRVEGKKIIFTNGCFDLVHAGHLASFTKAREFGDVLFVGVNSNASIKRIKGDKRPVVSQENRMKLLAALECVDYVVMFEDDTPEELIRKIKPNSLIKGADWENKTVAGGDFVRENGGSVHYIELEKGLSTTNIIEKILNTYKED